MAKSESLAEAVVSGSISSDKASALIGAAGDEIVDTELLDAVADLALNAAIPNATPTSPRCNAAGDTFASPTSPMA